MRSFPPAPGRPPGMERREMLSVWNRLHSEEDGQGTVEYVLVILAATAIALVLINWISGTNLFDGFFGGVLKKVIGFIK